MPLDRETITLTLSIWGSALATVIAVRTIIREMRDRARLQVAADITVRIPGGQRYFTVYLTNTGRRPVTVTWVAFKSDLPEMKGKIASVIVPDLPVTLDKEGDVKTIHLPIPEGLPNITRLFIRDSLNRIWQPSKRDIQTLRTQATAVPQRVNG